MRLTVQRGGVLLVEPRELCVELRMAPPQGLLFLRKRRSRFVSPMPHFVRSFFVG